ncbi:hypothetical protein B9Q01_02425 [Candidatus Marsarchaeota G1 archaeon OSP_D]|jgi:Predicted sugar phosphatases of the HAD superfamily|uniref:HAD family hydrolase n=2 Tax=Candidatus Marsarchaeota group 1 TaxID=2203770 RepID=A0A2R6AC87_9ARCH|nr:MAG: hypothetical protein B9Q01_02425 [Candidatus Marsarchaeota G1 archaeon OSP_D]PSN89282.1 MAG: hypothetical protein B9Q00_01990 [Candidatus Marsarchaeota G1 archaeon OSP_C]
MNELGALLIDIDGVVKRGSTLIEGSIEAFDIIKQSGVPFLLITNNSTKTPEQLSKEFEEKGLSIEKEKIFTSAKALVYALNSKKEYTKKALEGVLAIGEEGLLSELKQSGFKLETELTQGVVVVGLDSAFNYQKLVKAMRSIEQGALFFATNTDRTYPTEEGKLPGAGALVCSVVACTGKRPVLVGKPSKIFFKAALSALNLRNSNIVVIGDRPETDIRMANRNGCSSVLVLSGVTTQSELNKLREKPSFVAKNLLEAVKKLIY